VALPARRLDEFYGVSPGGHPLTRADLEGLLKRAADIIRTMVDYRFILLLLFLKRLSDVWVDEYEEEMADLVARGLPKDEAEEEAKAKAYHKYHMDEECLWDSIRRGPPAKLPERLARAFKRLEDLNQDFRGLFGWFNFDVFAQSHEAGEVLRQLFELFSGVNLGKKTVSADMIGDAYEWVLKHFAPQRAREGEILTPREVVRLLVELLDPRPGEWVCDPACGPGGMLIESHKYVRGKHGPEEARRLFLRGQERSPAIYALCKMNMILHEIDAEIALGDSLLRPAFKEGDALRKFDMVVANPPWNQDGYGEDVLRRGEFWGQRFRYGFPPKSTADWAWIQHMLAICKDGSGRVGVVIDQGTLFRGGRERAIRSKVVEEDLVECVILLPEKLFYNTMAPGTIIILRKDKPEDRKGKILFINASEEYEPHPSIRRLNILSPKNIERIVRAYRAFRDEPGFARVVPLDEVRDNDYNLNVSLYVAPLVEREEVDVKALWEEVKAIDREIEAIEERIEGYLREALVPAKEDELKETVVGRIPIEWDVVKLEKVAFFETGRRPKGGASEEGDVLSIGGEHITDFGDLDLSNPKFIPREFYDTLKQGIVETGDILLCKDGAKTGKVAYVKELDYPYASVNEHVFIIRSKNPKTADNRFVFYVLLSDIGQSQIKAVVHGMVGGITRRDLSNLKIPLPHIDEQERIADVLSTVDEAISLSKKAVGAIRALRDALMAELLTKGIGHEEFKETEIGRIPVEWDVVRLRDIILEAKPGFACGKRDENGVIQLRMDSIRTDGWINTEAFVKVPPPDNVEDYMLRPGDILFVNTSGSYDLVGKTALFRGEFDECVYSNHLTRIRVLEEKASSYWLFYILMWLWQRGLFKTLCNVQAGGQKNVGKSTLLSIRLPRPPLDEQKRIARILLTVDERLRAERERLERLRRLKEGLMGLLLTGRMRVRAA